MWTRIRTWLSRDAAPSLPTESDAEPPAGREEFLRFLQQHGVLVLATDIGPGRIDLVVHEYPTGEKVNPLFSGHGAARRWIQGRQLKEVTAFPSLTLEASWLVESFKSADKVVFDAGTPWERALGPEDLALLARIIHENGPKQKPPCGMRRLDKVPNPHWRLLLERR